VASNPKAPAESGIRWAPVICMAGAAFGVGMLLVGLVWKSATSPETFWTAEQAKEFEAASAALHATRDEAGHSHAVPSDEARQRFALISAELERARYARDELGPLLTKLGLATAVAFGIGYLIASRDSD
jgi:hypothetical protein